MKAIAPGKLIISGEHSVIYGMPAIAMAVKRQACATLGSPLKISPRQILFKLMSYGKTQSATIRELRNIRDKLVRKHGQFLKGEISFKEVVSRPFDLFNYVVVRLIDSFEIKLRKGLNICLDSDIPIGCGMGSSAATLLSLLRLLAHQFSLEQQFHKFVELGIEAERFQHLRSSGLDLHTSLNGGSICFERGSIRSQLPVINKHAYSIHTGIPESTTGECVLYAAESFKQSQHLAKDFGSVTESVASSMERNDFAGLQMLVRENHRLLNRIGVVPNKVRRFISEIEAQGGAAKICGAGSVRGAGGGIVLALTEEPLESLCQSYGYTCEPLQGDPLGVRMQN